MPRRFVHWGGRQRRGIRLVRESAVIRSHVSALTARASAILIKMAPSAPTPDCPDLAPGGNPARHRAVAASGRGDADWRAVRRRYRCGHGHARPHQSRHPIGADVGQTYEQHKAAVDAAHPTPVMTWYQTTGHDNPLHADDDREVAVGCALRSWERRIGSGLLSYISGNMIILVGYSLLLGPDDEDYHIPLGEATAGLHGQRVRLLSPLALEIWCEAQRVFIAAEKVCSRHYRGRPRCISRRRPPR